jgi:hypothetical protein
MCAGHLLDGRDVATEPVRIGILRGQGLVLPPENVPQAPEGISGSHSLDIFEVAYELRRVQQYAQAIFDERTAKSSSPLDAFSIY